MAISRAAWSREERKLGKNDSASAEIPTVLFVTLLGWDVQTM
jgi:hypothetical protein